MTWQARRCGQCGVADIPPDEWPYWFAGAPVHRRCHPVKTGAAEALAGDPAELRFQVHFRAVPNSDGGHDLTALLAGRDHVDVVADPEMLKKAARLLEELGRLVGSLTPGRG